jgi:ketosteroid isomerase-like protein
MSQQNLEVVRRWIELWNKGDWATFGAIHDPNVVVLPPDGWPDGEVSRGREAWTRQVIRLKDSWGTDRIEPEQLNEAGRKVIMHNRWTTKGKDSAIGFETWFWVVFTLSAGSVTRIEFFLDRSRALEAAGLST